MKFYRCFENSLVMIIIRLALPRDSCESSRFSKEKSRYSKEQAEVLPAFLRNCWGRAYTIQEERLCCGLWELFGNLPNQFHSGSGFAVVSLWWSSKMVFWCLFYLNPQGLPEEFQRRQIQCLLDSAFWWPQQSCPFGVVWLYFWR